jgi:ABC-2 type transport system permease protein
VGRLAFLLADVLLMTATALPGVALGAFVGAMRFDVEFSIRPWTLLLIIAISAMAASIGFAMAVALAPMVTQLLTQVLMIVVMLFAPVSYPAERMPGWLQGVHQFLPIEPMANLMRAGLMGQEFGVDVRDVMVLGAWGVGCLALAAGVLRRRV